MSVSAQSPADVRVELIVLLHKYSLLVSFFSGLSVSYFKPDHLVSEVTIQNAELKYWTGCLMNS